MSENAEKNERELIGFFDVDDDFDAVAIVNAIREAHGLEKLTEEEEKE